MSEKVGSAYVEVTPKLSDKVEGENKLKDKGRKSGDKFGSDFGSAAKGKVSAAAVAVGNILADAIKAGVSAAASMIGGAVDTFADYEQLVGGMDTLFGDASNQMQIYAYDAFATAQMSANDYMELSTSFAASLLQSLDGDTKAAAETANKAVIDMADNANKMGSSMADIENAYKGFSKQNYTMLDNLNTMGALAA